MPDRTDNDTENVVNVSEILKELLELVGAFDRDDIINKDTLDKLKTEAQEKENRAQLKNVLIEFFNYYSWCFKIGKTKIKGELKKLKKDDLSKLEDSDFQAFLERILSSMKEDIKVYLEKELLRIAEKEYKKHKKNGVKLDEISENDKGTDILDKIVKAVGKKIGETDNEELKNQLKESKTNYEDIIASYPTEINPESIKAYYEKLSKIQRKPSKIEKFVLKHKKVVAVTLAGSIIAGSIVLAAKGNNEPVREPEPVKTTEIKLDPTDPTKGSTSDVPVESVVATNEATVPVVETEMEQPTEPVATKPAVPEPTEPTEEDDIRESKGLGVIFKYRGKDDADTILEVLPGSLAEKMGLNTGDQIVSIDTFWMTGGFDMYGYSDIDNFYLDVRTDDTTTYRIEVDRAIDKYTWYKLINGEWKPVNQETGEVQYPDPTNGQNNNENQTSEGSGDKPTEGSEIPEETGKKTDDELDEKVITSEIEKEINDAAEAIRTNWLQFGHDYNTASIAELIKVLNGYDSAIDLGFARTIIQEVVDAAANAYLDNDSKPINISDLLLPGTKGKETVVDFERDFNTITTSTSLENIAVATQGNFNISADVFYISSGSGTSNLATGSIVALGVLATDFNCIAGFNLAPDDIIIIGLPDGSVLSMRATELTDFRPIEDAIASAMKAARTK